jgi:hypothetical protein
MCATRSKSGHIQNNLCLVEAGANGVRVLEQGNLGGLRDCRIDVL